MSGTTGTNSITKFTKKHVLTNPSSFVTFNFTNMTIYQKDIQHSNADDIKYFQVEYTSNRDADIVYSGTHPNYKINSIYITNLIHSNIKITNLDTSNGHFKGELIFEATNKVDGTKIFLCFLIAESTEEIKVTKDNTSLKVLYTDIIKNGDSYAQKYVSSTKTASLNLDTDTIPEQKECIIYTDIDGNITVVYLKPIVLPVSDIITSYTSTLTTSIPTTKLNGPALFTKTPVDSDIVSNISAGIASNINPNYQTDQEIYIDCNPTGESAERLTTYNIPIASDLMKDIDKSSFAQLTGNFILIGLIAFMCYVGVPLIYNAAVVDKMEKDDIGYSKYFITGYFVIIIIALFSTGGGIESLMAGLFVTAIAVITYVLISNDESNNNRSINFKIDGFLMFIVGVFKFILKFECISLIIGLFIIFLVIILPIRFVAKKKIKENGIEKEVDLISEKEFTAIMAWCSLVVIPFISVIMIRITTTKG